MAQAAVVKEVAEAARAAGKIIMNFHGIMASPAKAKVDEGIKLVREKNIDIILAVGGGSVIDCAKAAAIGTRYDGGWWNDFWLNQGVVNLQPFPLGVALAISGTSSEFDGGGVIIIKETNIKTGRLYPELSPDSSLLDPGCALTAPERQVRAAAFDTLLHLMELYFCKPDSDNACDFRLNP